MSEPIDPIVVGKRLDDVMREIRAGADPLTVGSVGNEMRANYQKDFERQDSYDKWPSEEKTVLALARLVGEMAAFLTKADATICGTALPTEVGPRFAHWSAYLVSKTICPLTFGLEPREGRHCRSYPPPDGSAEEAAAAARQALQQIPPFMETVSRAGRLK